MLKKRKSAVLEHPVPNFTGYDYSDVIGDFSEHDRLSEKDISQLICAHEFQLERPLNSFNDRELNDHLYHLFYCKKNRKYITNEAMDLLLCKTIPKTNHCNSSALSKLKEADARRLASMCKGWKTWRYYVCVPS